MAGPVQRKEALWVKLHWFYDKSTLGVSHLILMSTSQKYHGTLILVLIFNYFKIKMIALFLKMPPEKPDFRKHDIESNYVSFFKAVFRKVELQIQPVPCSVLPISHIIKYDRWMTEQRN